MARPQRSAEFQGCQPTTCHSRSRRRRQSSPYYELEGQKRFACIPCPSLTVIIKLPCPHPTVVPLGFEPQTGEVLGTELWAAGNSHRGLDCPHMDDTVQSPPRLLSSGWLVGGCGDISHLHLFTRHSFHFSTATPSCSLAYDLDIH